MCEFQIVKPSIHYIKPISELITFYEKSTQELLPRTEDQILQNLRDFWIALDTRENKLIGCVSLFFWSNKLAEIKSLAILPEFTGKGIGKLLVNKCLEDAKELAFDEVFALTFQPAFFLKMGFVLTERNNLPHKVWNECIRCPKLLTCGEIAVSFNLSD